MLAPVGGLVAARSATATHGTRPQPMYDIRSTDLEAVQKMKAPGSKWHWSVTPCAIVGLIATTRFAGRSTSSYSRTSVSRQARSKSRPSGSCFVTMLDSSLQNKAARPTDKVARAAWDYIIEASYDNTKKIKVKPQGKGDLSLGKYFQMPKKEFVQVPFCYGASMVPVGQQKSSAGKMEDYFECQVPEMTFPGVMTVQCSTMVYFRHHADKMEIIGDKTIMRGLGKDMEKTLNENMRFRIDCVTSWPEKDALRMQAKLKIAFDPPDVFRALTPQILFSGMSNPVTESVLHVLGGAFRDSFADDYKRWAESESFRLKRASAPDGKPSLQAA